MVSTFNPIVVVAKTGAVASYSHITAPGTYCIKSGKIEG